jgi:menaquinone-dependent protoporphyrinogen oxidase
MKKNTLIIYSSVDGQTMKICNRFLKILKEKDERTQLFHINDFKGKIDQYGKIIIASSIRYGKHNDKILQLITENTAVLKSKKTAFVSVNLVARKPEKSTAETNPYVKKFLDNLEWKPCKVGVFAGMLDYSKYSFMDKLLIRLIMLITKGPIFPDSAIEYTDWKKVDNFAKEIIHM